MTKALDWLRVAILSGVFLVGTLGLIATLDEFARVPFYATLPVAACLVNGAALFFFWRRKARPAVAGRVWSRLAAGRIFTEPAIPSHQSVEWDQNPAAPLFHTRDTFNQTHSREISAAVAKIHSVAWWFPPRAGSASVETQETK